MSLRLFCPPCLFIFLFLSAAPAAGQAIADFTFEDPADLLNNSVPGALDALSIHERARSDGEGVFTLNDPGNPTAHINIDLVLPKDIFDTTTTIYLEWDYKNIEGNDQSAWLINSGDNNHFGIFHYNGHGFVVRYYTLDKVTPGASADAFLTDFIPYPLDSGERAHIGFYYSQEEGMAYLYKNGEEIWRTTDSRHHDGSGAFYEPTPGHRFYWHTQQEELTVGAGMNGGWHEKPTLFRFRAFVEACSDDSPPTIDETETSTLICSGEPATLVATANDAQRYSWYQGPSSDNLTLIEGATDSVYTTGPLNSSQYFWVRVMRGPCESELDSVQVNVVSTPQAPTVQGDTSCGPSKITLQAKSNEPGVSFQWYERTGEAIPDETGSSYITPLLDKPTIYYVTTVNEEGCESDTVRVEAVILEKPGLAIWEIKPQPRCGPGEVELSIQQEKDFTYNLYRSPAESSIVEENIGDSLIFTVSRDTVFYLRAANGSCLGPPDRVEIKVSPVPSVIAAVGPGEGRTILKGESTSLLATFDVDSINSSSLRWEPAESLEQPSGKRTAASPQFTTTYTLHAESMNGCPVSDTVTIFVVDKLPVTNAFTPNGDGHQDTWKIPILAQDKYRNCKVIVFNRWGNQVFYSQGYRQQWDGTTNGKPLPAGTYYYTIILDDKHKPVRGSVLILR